jgi:hypothetical protein
LHTDAPPSEEEGGALEGGALPASSLAVRAVQREEGAGSGEHSGGSGDGAAAAVERARRRYKKYAAAATAAIASARIMNRTPPGQTVAALQGRVEAAARASVRAQTQRVRAREGK